jgi:hypothetical protein
MVSPLIFRQSVEKGVVTDEWKKAQISAICKKEDKAQAGNYRPVILTSVVSKVMENIVSAHIIDHMRKNNHFTRKQYGFMSGRSTALQLLAVMDRWTEALDTGDSIDCIYMDFKKEFDTVPHTRLISKLTSYGFNTEMVNWIASFLADRVQQVTINEENSKWKDVVSGIPQGSVLGPILFVVYIHDLPDQVASDLFFVC